MKKFTPIFILLAILFSWQISAQITSYPYNEDFESGDGGWTAVNGAGGTWALGAPAATIINSADTGLNAWVTNLTGDYNANDDSSVESPVFDFTTLSAPAIELAIWWNSEFSWDGTVLQSSIDGGTSWQNVGALGDPNNWFNDGTIAGNPGGQGIGWTGRQTSGNGSGGWVIARNSLDALAGEASVIFRVAFGSDGTVQDEGFGFDTVSVFDVSCPEPTNVLISNITENSVDITWTAEPTETAWEYVVQPSGTGVPTGNGTSALTTSVNITSLDPSTAYEIFIRTDCGGSGFSVWTGPFNFTTTNIPPPPPVGVTCSSGPSTYIFTEDFETDPPIGWTGTGFSGTNGNWDITSGNANSAGTGPFVSQNGTSHLEYEASGDSSTIASSISPAIDLTTAADGAELSFFMHAFGADIGTLNVNVGTAATGPFTTLYTWIGEFQTADTDAWVPIGINLDAYLGQIIYIEFSYGGAGTGFEGDLSIDFVRVESCGTFCIAPSSITVANITGTSADISWTGNNGETSWEYVVQPAGTGEPTAAGSTTAVANVNISSLDFSTDYEVYVLANCTAGDSAWAGPINFTTLEQTDFSVDCSVGPVNQSFCYDNGGETDPVIYTFTSTDGSPLRLTFNSGLVENNWDELVVIDSDGSFIVNPDDDFYGNSGDLSGLFYVSTGDTISFYINSDGTVSCQSSTGDLSNGIDYTVACATCTTPEATFAVISDCVNGPQFLVEVDLTSIGSATSITLSDDQSSPNQTANSPGLYTFGPYANLTNVVITIANDDDVNCILNSNSLTQEFCTDIFLDCAAGPITTDYCYPDGGDTNPEIFTFTSNDGTPLNLNFNSGEIENGWDELVVIDSDGSFIVSPTDDFYGNNGDLSGLSYQSTGDTISFYINSDGIISCQAGSAGLDQGINYTVACATCINPQANYSVIDDCDNGDQFLIDVDVTTLGDATSLTISNNIDSNTVAVTTIGTYQIGPFPFLVDVVVTLSNDQDVNCVINSPVIQLLACPPDNDNCDGAVVAVVNEGSTCDLITSGTILAATPSGVPVGSCSGNPDDDVWFEFTALSEVQIISMINITGGFDIEHAVYEGSCGALTELYCSNNDASVTPALTVGNTYYIRVFSGGSDAETTSFDLCIREAPSNIICENAENFCSVGGALTSSNIIGIPSNGQIACLGSDPNPTWNIIQIGNPGLIEIEIVQTDANGNGLDVDFVLWGPFTSVANACNNLDIGCPSPGDCPNNTSSPNFYPSGNIVDCSYSVFSTENLTIDNALEGEVYILLVTNFNGNPGTITINQTNLGNGGTIEAEIDAEIISNEVVFADLDNDPTTPDEAAVCGFDSITIETDSPFADTYIWYKDGFVIEGETSSTLTVTESNTYQVQAFDEQCGDDAFSQIIAVNLYEDPGEIPAQNITVCDGPTNDGSEDFDLDALTTSLNLGAEFVVTYYLTVTDANQAINAVSSPYTSSGETLIIRAEDANAASNGYLGCRQLSEVELVVNPSPDINQPMDLIVCDDDTDGVTSFDLTQLDSEITTDSNVVISYHLTQEDADNGVGALSSPYSSSGAIIFVRAENNLSGCINTTSFNIIVNEVPQATFDPQFDYEVCPNATVPVSIGLVPTNFTADQVIVEWFLDGGLIAGESGLVLDTVLVEGDYSAEITFNTSGCVGFVETFVEELESCVIPEGISPNNDGFNDRFDLSSYDVTKLEIFNRNGTLVYSKTNYTR